MNDDFKNLTLDDVSVGGEKIIENQDIEPEEINEDLETEDQEQEEERENLDSNQEQSSEEPKEEIKDEEPKEVASDDFPKDKLGGKYNSWEELEQALSNPVAELKDDFIKKVVDKYNQDGSLEDFFKAYSTDWDKVDDKEVLKKKFFEDNADIEDTKTLERLWKKEISKYTIDEDEYDEEEVETGLALLKRDAKKVRAEFKEQQAKYIEPSKNKESDTEEIQRIEALKNFVEKDPIVQSVKQTKIVSLDIDGEKYNFEVDNPEIIADSLVNENLFYNQFIKEGKPDTAKWAEVMAYATNPQKFRKSLVDFGRSLERKSVEDELKNTKLPRQESSKQNSSGDDREDLLNAFVSKGKLVKR
jgi:hypothetical protein